ncbi:hypothetical protein V5O48_013888 [Marasmius crinis-equi]|uniref:YTH domain-containing protein n=1 Tax=Marasmius crinis-equi TaxID=585013 RepID=A0ABR3EYT5_9AGAR
MEKVLDQLDLPKSPTSPAPMTEHEASHTATPTTPHPIDREERHTGPFEEEVLLPDSELQDGLIFRAGESKETESDEERTPSQDDVFRVDWICTDHLPYSRTGYIRNPWNHDRQVKFSGDGHELEPGTGQQIIDEWQRFMAEVRAGDRGLPRRRQTASSHSG